VSEAGARPPLAQLAKFGVVGLLASAVHAGVYLATAETLLLTPLLANLAGFSCAFGVSYLGHRHWTFAAQAAGTHAASTLAKFLATALLGFTSNHLITWLLVERLALPKASALIGILFVTPLLTFACSKYWAFAHRGPRPAGLNG
jgi:putative flippase GtrA